MSSVTAMTPPVGRDFEIHRLNRVEHVSTYRLAERFNISQTRVRQIVHRVGEWLASVLPDKSDAQRERETRLAKCLAADQLQSQIEKLQVYWDETRDPKFLRQQTRAILALARLGVMPGAIDAAEADAGTEVGERRPEVGERRPEVGERRSEIGGASADVANRRDDDSSAPPSVSSNRPPTADYRPPSSDLRPLSSDFQPQSLNADKAEAYLTTPPAGDCSLNEVNAREQRAAKAGMDSANDDHIATYDSDSAQSTEELAGLKLIESRLLTLLGGTPPDDHQGRQGLEETLGNIRRERLACEIRLSPEVAGARVALR